MKRLVSDTWFPEVLFLSVSWAAFVTIIVLLQNFDQEPIFSWYDFGLNTVVSTMSTTMKCSLLFVTSSCIGQGAYTAFTQSSGPVIHFETHDSASRGPWGSVILLWRNRKRLYRSTPALGASLIILSLFIDPFFQQIITLGKRQTKNNQETVQIPRATRHSRGREMVFFEKENETRYPVLQTFTDFSIQSALRAGLASPNTKVTVDARCPSTTCTWEKYTTLAVCSKCFSVTKNLAKETVRYNETELYVDQVSRILFPRERSRSLLADVDTYYLPNGLYFENMNIGLRIVMSGTFNKSDTIHFKDESRLLYSVSTIKHENSSKIPCTATECGLSLCVKEMTSRSVNGVLEEYAIEIDVPTILNSQKLDKEADYFVRIEDYARQDLQFDGNISITRISINSMGAELDSLFGPADPGGKTGTLGGQVPRRYQPSRYDGGNGYGWYMSYNGIGGGPPIYSPSLMEVLHSSPDIGRLFDQLAESLTNSLRLGDESSTVALGTSAIVVHDIRWVYITLPVIYMLGGTVFFFLSVLQTHRLGAPLWKSSAIAILKCGATLEGFSHDENRVSKMEIVAKSTAFELTEIHCKARSSCTNTKQNI